MAQQFLLCVCTQEPGNRGLDGRLYVHVHRSVFTGRAARVPSAEGRMSTGSPTRGPWSAREGDGPAHAACVSLEAAAERNAPCERRRAVRLPDGRQQAVRRRESMEAISTGMRSAWEDEKAWTRMW